MDRPGCTDDALLILGFVLGAVTDDPLFQHAQLPPGWRRRATGYALFTALVDDRGRERFEVVSKAYPNRVARLRPRHRFAVHGYLPGCDPDHYVAAIKDGGRIICRFLEWRKEDWQTGAKSRARAEAWLSRAYPEWRDPFAYWD